MGTRVSLKGHAGVLICEKVVNKTSINQDKTVFIYINLKRRLPSLIRKGLGWAFSRSSGPGGQNVNKRNTKALLRVDSSVVPSEFLSCVSSIPYFNGKRTRDGSLLFSSQKHRTQAKNRQECLQKLSNALDMAERLASPPSPPSAQHLQRIQARMDMANKKRLSDKHYRSNKKASRRAVQNEKW
ncbi:hypothetical protein PORY_001947 [Pneumocystis oryctolagi]|uniref:Uncharacterized protein n=1 Tax=Pneumocystis oryctolagi TaxID=42067 RepID=A0ACB7CA07_9ASCO|nr:hypothetical protein PORY_001947 [Pneumocystis oryctolagi]